MHKSREYWSKVVAASVPAGSEAQVASVLQMALDDIEALHRESDFYNRTMHYNTKRETFQTCWSDHNDRIGQAFEIVGVNCSDELMADGGGGPRFDIRFPDGTIIDADELEVFSGCGWDPDAEPAPAVAAA